MTAEKREAHRVSFRGHHTRKRNQMSLRKRYQWVKKTSKHWQAVTRHFCANVEVFSWGWCARKATTSARSPGSLADALTVSADSYSAFWLPHSR
jgi:hypothetical protein